MKSISVLGTFYKIKYSTPEKDSKLESCDGYTDVTTKTIVIDNGNGNEPDSVADIDTYRNQVLLHELIHAFLFESGLHTNSKHEWAVNEEIIDWMAIQLPKIWKTYKNIC